MNERILIAPQINVELLFGYVSRFTQTYLVHYRTCLYLAGNERLLCPHGHPMSRGVICMYSHTISLLAYKLVVRVGIVSPHTRDLNLV